MELGDFNVVPTLLFNYTGDQYGDLNEPVRAADGVVFDHRPRGGDLRQGEPLPAVALCPQPHGRELRGADDVAATRLRPRTGDAPRLQIPREAERYFGAEFRMYFGGSR